MLDYAVLLRFNARANSFTLVTVADPLRRTWPLTVRTARFIATIYRLLLASRG